MKNIIYIGFLFLALGMSSCTKEEIVQSAVDNDVPAWEGSNALNRSGSIEIDPPASNDGNTSGGVVNPIPSPTPPIGEITDPNNDPDGKKKKQ